MINILGYASREHKQIALKSATLALNFLKQQTLEVSIKFVSKEEIQRLNKEFRNIDKVTDVLSFPATNCKIGDTLPENEYLGDMALCVARAKEQSKDYGTTVEAELSKLVVHSVLHLFGYDHIKDEDYKIMKKEEEKIEKYIKEQQQKNGI